MNIVGNIIIAAGVIFIIFGIIGIYRFKSFYVRILMSAKVDTVGVITIIIGLVIKHGLSFFSLKLLLLMLLMIIINPLASNMIARSAYLSDYQAEDKSSKNKRKYDEGNI